MNHVYIIVPIGFSLLLFALTVGYLLFVKYKASRLLKSIRRDMVLKHCSAEFATKPFDITHGQVLFTGVYREPSIPMINRLYSQNQNLNSFSKNYGFDSVHTPDENSDVIEVPLRPYVHHSSSSSSEATGGPHYDRSAYYNTHICIDEGDSETYDGEKMHPPLQCDRYQHEGVSFKQKNVRHSQSYQRR